MTAIISTSKPGSTNNETVNSFAKGVSLSPKSYSSADFTDFFVKAKQAGTLVSWAGDWNDLGNQNGAATVLASLVSTYGYDPVFELQFFNQSNGALFRPLTSETEQAYKDLAVTFVQKFKPKYLALGIEVNMLYEKSPTDFEAFVKLYSQVYDAVKGTSPDTQVFTIFQLEKMKGLGGGLFGGTNNPATSEWGILERFSKMDLVAFTTYPGLIYKTPSEIPTDYYSEIQQHTNKKVAFTEIGWHSGATPVGWESSNAEQAEFVTMFFDLTADLNNKEMAIWSFLYDQNAAVPFNSMGLFDANGDAKLSWNTWVNAK